jgi:hypothetical protein
MPRILTWRKQHWGEAFARFYYLKKYNVDLKDNDSRRTDIFPQTTPDEKSKIRDAIRELYEQFLVKKRGPMAVLPEISEKIEKLVIELQEKIGETELQDYREAKAEELLWRSGCSFGFSPSVSRAVSSELIPTGSSICRKLGRFRIE